MLELAHANDGLSNPMLESDQWQTLRARARGDARPASVAGDNNDDNDVNVDEEGDVDAINTAEAPLLQAVWVSRE